MSNPLFIAFVEANRFKNQPPTRIFPYVYYWCTCKKIQLTNNKQKISRHINRQTQHNSDGIRTFNSTASASPAVHHNISVPNEIPSSTVDEKQNSTQSETTATTSNIQSNPLDNVVEQLRVENEALREENTNLYRMQKEVSDSNTMLEYENNILSQSIESSQDCEPNRTAECKLNTITSKAELLQEVIDKLSQQLRIVEASNDHNQAQQEMALLASFFIIHFTDSSTLDGSDYCSIKMITGIIGLIHKLVSIFDVTHLIKIRSTLVQTSVALNTTTFLYHCYNRILESIVDLPVSGCDMLDSYVVLVEIVSFGLECHSSQVQTGIKLYPHHLDHIDAVCFWYQFISQVVKRQLRLEDVYMSDYPLQDQLSIISIQIDASKKHVSKLFRNSMMVNHSDRIGTGSHIMAATTTTLKSRLLKLGDANDLFTAATSKIIALNPNKSCDLKADHLQDFLKRIHNRQVINDMWHNTSTQSSPAQPTSSSFPHHSERTSFQNRSYQAHPQEHRRYNGHSNSPSSSSSRKRWRSRSRSPSQYRKTSHKRSRNDYGYRLT